MRPLVMATAAFVAMSAADAAGGASASSTYRWSKRPLFVFAGDAADKALAEQRRIVAGSRSGFSERDVVVVYVVGDSVSAELGGKPGQSAGALRARYGGGGSQFEAVLVGKDGGAKLSSGKPLTAATLFSTIDAMPMRRDEMRRP